METHLPKSGLWSHNRVPVDHVNPRLRVHHARKRTIVLRKQGRIPESNASSRVALPVPWTAIVVLHERNVIGARVCRGLMALSMYDFLITTSAYAEYNLPRYTRPVKSAFSSGAVMNSHWSKMYPPTAGREERLWAVIAEEARFAPVIHSL
jgi:hypothetical protein